MPSECLCAVCVSSSEVGVVEKMGKFDRELTAGCHCLKPCVETLRGVLSLRIMAIPINIESKTKDNVMVNVYVSVHYQVLPDRVQDAFYRFSNPVQQITDFTSNVIRGQLPMHNLDDVFTLKEEMAKALKEELDAKMMRYGFNIVSTLIVGIDPARAVKDAMNQINTNSRERVAIGYKSEADKIEIIKAAEAEAEAKRLSGVGLAEQRRAAIAGLQTSVESFKEHVEGITSAEVMSLLLMNQYFDTLKEITERSKGSVIFTPAGPQDIATSMMAANAGKMKRN